MSGFNIFVIQEWNNKVYELSVPKDTTLDGLLEKMYRLFKLDSDEFYLELKIKLKSNRGVIFWNDDHIRHFMSMAEKNPRYCPLHVNIERRNMNLGIEDNTIGLGKAFWDKVALLFAVSINAIRDRFQFAVEKCNEELLVVRCLDNKCKWRVCDRKSGQDCFRVVEYENVHTCSREIMKGDHPQATCWFVEKYIWSMQIVPGLVYGSDVIVKDMQSKLGISICQGKARQARENVLKELKMSPERLFSLLPSYCGLMKSKNQGTVMHLETNNEDRFKYLFMALYASIQGWMTCRPVIEIDGTSMKAYGMLFAVMCKDGNNQIFPLAFSIVDSENDESWDWFLTKFKEAFGDRDNLVVISKHTESICKAVSKVYPKSEHCICLQHLLKNVNAKFEKELETCSPFIKASEAYHVSEFGKLMNEIKHVDVHIYDYLLEIGCEKWARAYFTGNRYNIMRTNVAKFLNYTRDTVGHLYPLAVVGNLTLVFQHLFSERHKEASKMTSKLTKWVDDVLRRKGENTINMNMKVFLLVSCLQYDKFQVTDGIKNFNIDLREKTCSCREFELDQMPCSHALAVLRELNMLDQLPYLFCSHYYTLKSLKQTYAETIHPLGNMSKWEAPEEVQLRIVLPPTSLWSGVRP